MLGQRKSYSFLNDVFGCSTLDGCAPLEKSSAVLSPTKANPVIDFTVGEEVTCFHDDMEEWYHAKVIAVNSDITVDVEYMDGEVEKCKSTENIFRGSLSMDQVRVGVEVRNGCRDLDSSVILPPTLSTPNVLDFNLAGLSGKRSQTCVGLFISMAHLSRRFSETFVGMNAAQMSKSTDFLAVLESDEVSKLALVHFCSRTKTKDIINKMFSHVDPSREFSKNLAATLPKTIQAGSTLSVAFMGQKGGVEVTFEVEKADKENTKSFSLSSEGAEELGGLLRVIECMSGVESAAEDAEMKSKIFARVPELLRV